MLMVTPPCSGSHMGKGQSSWMNGVGRDQEIVRRKTQISWWTRPASLDVVKSLTSSKPSRPRDAIDVPQARGGFIDLIFGGSIVAATEDFAPAPGIRSIRAADDPGVFELWHTPFLSRSLLTTGARSSVSNDRRRA